MRRSRGRDELPEFVKAPLPPRPAPAPLFRPCTMETSTGKHKGIRSMRLGMVGAGCMEDGGFVLVLARSLCGTRKVEYCRHVPVQHCRLNVCVGVWVCALYGGT